MGGRRLDVSLGKHYTYALKHCYPVSTSFAVMYTCEAGVFAQLSYRNGDCAGNPASEMGGSSPWHCLATTWTCREGADACARAWKVSNATVCVDADRELHAVEKVGILGMITSEHAGPSGIDTHELLV